MPENVKVKNLLGTGERVNIENIGSDFVSLASHQLRTPLSAIKWNIEILLKERQGRLTIRQKQYLEEIYRLNERAINLVNDLLDVSRIQEGQIHLQYTLIRAEDIIEEVIQSFSSLIKTTKIKVNFEIVNGPLPKILTDAEKLKRVVINLLSNAIKYTPQNKEVHVSVEKKDRYLKVSIADSGVGITKEERKKIFSKFFRSPRIIKIAPDGTGLGLFIAKFLLKAMGGKISFQSRDGMGTTFYFTLPLKN